MHILLVGLLISVVSIGAYAEAQFYPSLHGDNYFRANLPQPSHDIPLLKNEPRFLFTTLSLTLATVTVQSTTTTTTSCTTSTAALIQCTNSGRRRRGLFTDNGAGLYYSEDGKEESPFLPKIQKEEVKLVESEVEAIREQRQAPPVPFVVQPGFSVPSDKARVFLHFGTSTTTLFSTDTTTVSLTAICRSTSSYQLCGSSGK